MTEEINVNIVNHKSGALTHITHVQIFNVFEDYSYKLVGNYARKKKYTNNHLK